MGKAGNYSSLNLSTLNLSSSQLGLHFCLGDCQFPNRATLTSDLELIQLVGGLSSQLAKEHITSYLAVSMNSNPL